MRIQAIEIEGQNEDVRIERTATGACVMTGMVCIAAFGREEGSKARYAKARAIYGDDRRGRPAATNSMVNDLLVEIDRVIGY